MSEFLQRIREFTWAVVTNWAGLSTGGILVATLGLWQTYRKPFPRKVALSLASFFLLISFFKTWQDQRILRISAEQELAHRFVPDFAFTLGQVMTQDQPDTNNTLVFLSAMIINRGFESAVPRWYVHYQSPTLDTDLPMVSFGGQTLTIHTEGHSVFLPSSESLFVKTGSPISRGSMVIGRFPIMVPGLRGEEIGSGAAIITVTITDYLDRSYTAKFTSTSAIQQRFDALPGDAFRPDQPTVPNP